MTNTTPKSSPVSCIHCREIKSTRGIFSHFLHSHASEEDSERMKRGLKRGCAAASTHNEKQKKEKNNRIHKYNETPNECINCSAALSYEQRKNKFCSNACSAKTNNKNRPNRNIESRKKTSDAIKQLHVLDPNKSKRMRDSKPTSSKPTSRVYFPTCVICKSTFTCRTNRKTCSDGCRLIASTKRRTNFFYKGIRMDSSWEVDLAIWLDDNHISWIRPTTPITFQFDKPRKYWPDFYLPEMDIYLDPKNKYRINTTIDKLKAIQNQIHLIYGDVTYITNVVMGMLGSNQRNARVKV